MASPFSSMPSTFSTPSSTPKKSSTDNLFGFTGSRPPPPPPLFSSSGFSAPAADSGDPGAANVFGHPSTSSPSLSSSFGSARDPGATNVFSFPSNFGFPSTAPLFNPDSFNTNEIFSSFLSPGSFSSTTANPLSPSMSKSTTASSFAPLNVMTSATSKMATSTPRSAAATSSTVTSETAANSAATSMTSASTTAATSSSPRSAAVCTSDTTSETATANAAASTVSSPTSASDPISTAASKALPKFFAAVREARSRFAAQPTLAGPQARQLMTTLIDLLARGSSAVASDQDAVAEMGRIVSTLLSASLPSSLAGHLGFLENSLTLFMALPAESKLTSDDMCSKQSEVKSLIPELEILEKDFRVMEIKEVDLDSAIRVTAQEVEDLEERLMAAKGKLRSLRSRRASIVSAKSDCLVEGQELEKQLTKALSAEASAIRTFNSVKRRQEMADAQWQIILEGLKASLPQLS